MQLYYSKNCDICEYKNSYIFKEECHNCIDLKTGCFTRFKSTLKPNKETIKAINESENNINMIKCENVEDMFSKLDINIANSLAIHDEETTLDSNFQPIKKDQLEKSDQVSDQVEKSCGNCVNKNKEGEKYDYQAGYFKECDDCKNKSKWLPIEEEQSEKVIYKGCVDEQVQFGNNDDPRDLLEIGKIYELKKKEIHSWHTKYILKDFPDKKFNSVCFQSIEQEQQEEQTDEIQQKFKISQLENELAEKDKEISDLKIQAKSLSAQFERAEMFRGQLEEKDKEIERLEEANREFRKALYKETE
jgi:hypothetical protein